MATLSTNAPQNEQTAADWSQCLEQASLSDVGMQRMNNQDSFAVSLADNQADFDRRGHLFVVADGMGAHAAGELASRMAADIIALTYRKRLDLLPSDALLGAIHNANHQIHSRGQASPDFRGMGTTVTSLALLPAGALLAQVGDSRTYRWRNDCLHQLTFDHSLVWEMRAAGQFANGETPHYISKNIITRSLGPHPAVKIDLEGPLPVEPGDTFMLCSDGLSNQLQDDEIGLIIGCLPPTEAVRALVDLANLRGGNDNITTVVVRVLGPQVAQNNTNTASPPAEVHPVHPLIWTVVGVATLSSVGLFLLGHALSGLISMAGAGVGLLAALVQRYGLGRQRSLRRGQFGRGPYVTQDCTPNPELLGRFSDILHKLKESVSSQRRKIDWNACQAIIARADAAQQAGNLADAARETLRAIMFIMEQVRRQPSDGFSDSDIVGLNI